MVSNIVKLLNVSRTIVCNQFTMGGGLSILVQIKFILFDKFRHREVVY